MSDIMKYDAVTGETTFEEFTAEEKAAFGTSSIDGQDQIDAIILEEENKALLKQQAINALTALGLTEAQARALAGI